MENKKSFDNFWVIGVGSSAGGLEALTAFVKNIPKNSNAAFIVAQHLAPHAKSMMVELLNRHSSMPVVAVENHLLLKPGLICIVPPNHDVVVEDNELRLSIAGNETRPKPSVDTFFKSLAEVYKSRAVGIILSGTGSDGSEGIRAIKENGGTTFVQDTESAKYDGMPKSAFDTGLVDAVLTPEEIGSEMFRILEEKKNPKPVVDQMFDQEDFKKIITYLKSEVGTDFVRYKEATIKRRLHKRLQALHITELPEYYKILQGNGSELSLLAQEMLVSVTSFFRDPDAFITLTKHLEEIFSRKSQNEEFRVWIAGCATGEESYTFSMVLNEIMERIGKKIPIKIFATDLDQEALNQARSGIYSEAEVSSVPQNLLEKYFIRHEKHWEVKKYIRELIVFARQDLTLNPPFVKLDLISCRNVLIYFDSSLQNRIFETFHYSLKPQGLLFLGKSESTDQVLFENVDRKDKIFRKVPGVSRYTHSKNGRPAMQPSSLPIRRKPAPGVNFHEVVPLQMMNVLGASGVVVDDTGLVVHLMGDLSEFMTLPVGEPDFRLQNLLQKNMAVEFSVLLKKAKKDGKTIRSRLYKLEGQAKKNVCMSMTELTQPEGHAPLTLVVFELKKQIPTASEHEKVLTTEAPGRILELEQELEALRENLQTVIEELEISNEELQSLNEELSSTNEEMQASNEELETTNEEMQSTNEELTTLNEELNVKSSELRMANASLENIQTSISSPLLVVDRELKLVRYNNNANLIFNLSFSDLGTNIAFASCQCEIPDFENNIKKTIETGNVAEVICTSGAKVFQMRVHPNRDENKQIIGAIIVFFDNTEFIRSQEKLQASDRRIRSIIDNSPTLISLKDNLGKYLIANEAFYRYFGLKETQVLGKTDREIFPDKLAQQFRDSDLEVLLKREPTQKQEILKHEGKEIIFLSNRFALTGVNDKTPYAVGCVSLDITQQVQDQDELRKSESRYRAIIEDQAVYVCRHLPGGDLNFTNTAFSKFFDVIHSKNFLEMVGKADREKVEAKIQEISDSTPIVQYEHRYQRPGSRQLSWIRWIHRGLFNERREIVEYQAVGFDVTDIHNITSDLLAKENLFTHVLEHTSDYLSVYRLENKDLVLESFNQSAAKNREFNNPRLIGKKLKELIDPEYFETVLPHYKKAIETETIQNFEETYNGPGGVRTLSTTLVPVRDVDVKSLKIVVINRDVTNLKRIERALVDEKINAESANNAKTEFLASMSHELRTPLNVIMGMSQLLSMKTKDEGQLKYVDSIQRSGKTLLSLIEDVLDLSKIEAGKVDLNNAPFNINQLVEDVVVSFEGVSQKKQIEIISRIPPIPIVLLGDEMRLKQVLVNLIGNAIKFTEKGSVSIQLTTKKLANSTALTFKVIDTGVGIPMDSFPKIFQRFSQAESGTSRKFGGSGLGLAISKQLIDLMGGDIGFDSKLNEGSVFWFTLTLPDGELKPEVKQNIDLQIFKNLKVLAIDDVPESLKVVKLILEEIGVAVDGAGSGKECLSLLQKNSYDVVLMDMQMPEMDGLETTQKIRKELELENLPVIALTANAMMQDRKKAMEAGMNDFLTKPVNFDQLTSTLAKFVPQKDPK